MTTRGSEVTELRAADDRIGASRGVTADDAVRILEDAHAWTKSVDTVRDLTASMEAERDLRAAVDLARIAGVKWGRIGATLGIARGNAYQKYRTRPSGESAVRGPAL